ncbi:MAG TPA: hypothetical protein ENK13_01935 [Thermopetrobacter sp.]|nr:hypothetical protein [Thermopetrobacter sp.]
MPHFLRAPWALLLVILLTWAQPDATTARERDGRPVNEALADIVAQATGLASESDAAEATPGREVRIGVLAFRGSDEARRRWAPLAEYLSTVVAGARFVLRPVTLDSARSLLKAGTIDYLITNPGHYVSLTREVPLAPLATLERFVDREQRHGLVRFGSVIVVRADSGIKTLADLAGRRLTAVSPEAFGGFQMAWAEFMAQDIDPFRDLGTVRFAGFPQDAIVEAVVKGETDAGVVRTGLLESMAREGRIRLGEVRVLQGGRYPGWPLRVSSRLYPEWPFLARQGAPKRITEAVTRALLATQDAGVRAAHGLRIAWTTPQPYEDVRQLVAAYRAWRRTTVESALSGLAVSAPLAVVALLLGGLLIFVTMRLRGGRVAAAGAPSSAPPPTRGTERTAGDAAMAECFRRLTPREQEVLRLLCRGKSTKAIARELSISPKTVEYHRANLLRKTGVKSATSLVWLATRQGFDDMTPESGAA